jgi:hypothetical protein
MSVETIYKNLNIEFNIRDRRQCTIIYKVIFRCKLMNHLLVNGLTIVSLSSLLGFYTTTISADAAPKPARSTKPVVKPEPKQTNISRTTIQDNGVRYELSACRRIEATVVCRFSLVNKSGKDMAISFKTSGTRFIDKDGEEYLSKEVQIGSVKSESEAENTLIADVPTKATVTFDDPPVNVSTMAVLAINHSPGATLKFRNVKITK